MIGSNADADDVKEQRKNDAYRKDRSHPRVRERRRSRNESDEENQVGALVFCQTLIEQQNIVVRSLLMCSLDPVVYDR